MSMYQRILVPIDGSETSLAGLREAIRMARFTHGRLRLVHVVDKLAYAPGIDLYPDAGRRWLDALYADGARLLEQAKADAGDAGVEVETVLHDYFAGPVHERVVADAAEWPADLIVLGSHGRHGAQRALQGSDAESVVRRSPVPVLLVHAPPSGAASDGD